MDDDSNRWDARKAELLNLIQRQFPGDHIEVLSLESPRKLTLSILRESKPRSPHVTINPSENLMTDIDNGYEKIFLDGIEIAKEILKSPPLPTKNFQGKIMLLNEGARFYLRED